MKRSWLGFLLLLVLLAAGLLTTRNMTEIHEPIEAQLLQAAYWSALEDWETAESFFQKAEQNWKQSEHFRACFADHDPVEERLAIPWRHRLLRSWPRPWLSCAANAR